MSHRNRYKLLPLAVAAALLAACSLAPTYQRPASPVAAEWPQAGADGAANAGAAGTGGGHARAGAAGSAPSAADQPAAHDIAWQDFFRDAALKQAIAQALEHNRDLRVAVLNIERARALYQIQSADRLPSLNAGVSGASQRVPNKVSPGGFGGIGRDDSVSVGVPSFEVDLFGRVRNLSQAALERYAATGEARRSAQISLIAEVASVYEAALADQRLLDLSRQTQASRSESHQRQRQLYEQGASSEFDLRQSESLLEAAKVAVAQSTRQRARDENALSVLVGAPLAPGLLRPVPGRGNADIDVDGTQSARHVMADLPAGLPSDLLAARPDIRQQEALLRAANANIGVARAAFFPRITLTGAFGSASNELSGLFDSGSRAWSFLPQATLPIFDGGRNRANLGAARADRDIAVAQYEKTIELAFRDVADALAGRATLTEELRAVQAQERAEQIRYELAKLRYDAGQSSYLEYLDAQRSLFAAQQQAIRTSLAELQNRIGLYKALGGGWQAASEAAAASAAHVPDHA